jgi:glycosyltransferase involved in cell wall biosynthesis
LTVYTDATTHGGAEQSVATLLAHLDEHVEATVLGVEAEVVEWIAAQRPGTRHRLVPRVRNKFDLGPIYAHIRAVRSLRPHVFQANLPTTFSCQYGILAALLTPGVSVVVVEHSPIESASGVQRFLKRALSKRVDAHVSVGIYSARAAERAIGLREGSIRTIYTGVPKASGNSPNKRRSWPVVGSLGRLSQEKGYDVLVRALALLDGVRLVLVGDGPARADLVSLAQDLGISERLEITGWKANAREYLGGFDVFALPSRFEGLPLSVVEAMLAGLPIVATNVGSLSEAVLNNETGLLIPPDDPAALAEALRSLLEDPERRRQMGERGLRSANERFTITAMVRSYESLYAGFQP